MNFSSGGAMIALGVMAAIGIDYGAGTISPAASPPPVVVGLTRSISRPAFMPGDEISTVLEWVDGAGVSHAVDVTLIIQ